MLGKTNCSNIIRLINSLQCRRGLYIFLAWDLYLSLCIRHTCILYIGHYIRHIYSIFSLFDILIFRVVVLYLSLELAR